jgi:hypothetical protein
LAAIPPLGVGPGADCDAIFGPGPNIEAGSQANKENDNVHLDRPTTLPELPEPNLVSLSLKEPRL